MTIPTGDAVDGPLASVGVRVLHRPAGSGAAVSRPCVPLVLRVTEVAPERESPTYVYDPVRQVAVASDGSPLAPTLEKKWTSYESTHTDGDGGDNEVWDWEEVRP